MKEKARTVVVQQKGTIYYLIFPQKKKEGSSYCSRTQHMSCIMKHDKKIVKKILQRTLISALCCSTVWSTLPGMDL